MRRSGPYRLVLALCIGVVFAALSGAFFLSYAQSSKRADDLSASLDERQAADRENALVRSVAGFLDPQAVLVDGRRGVALQAVAHAADDPRLTAWASAGAEKRPGALLAALCAGKGWVSAVLADRNGRVVAAWPAAKASGDLSGDPYFKVLSSADMGPGIVRHGYTRAALPLAAPAAKRTQEKARETVQLVAACGVADREGAFGGLLKVRMDARRILFGAWPPPFDALLSAYPGARVVYASGDGRELYDSAEPALTQDLTALPGGGSLLDSSMNAPAGSQDLSAGGTVAVWQRVGSAPRGAAPADVLGLYAMIPRASAIPASAPPRGWLGAFTGVAPLLAGHPEISGLLLAAALAFLSALALLMLPATAAAPPAARLNAVEAPLAPLPAPPTDHAAELGLLKQLQDELAISQVALAESHQEREKDQREFERLRAQADELRASAESLKRDAVRSAEEARLMRAKAEDSGAQRPAQVAGTPGPEHEAARLAAINTLSTELKATLEVIKNYINSLLGGQGAFGDAQQEFLGLVINKSARLERLIGDLVDLSEISMGLNAQRMETAPLAALVQEALVNARPQAENKNVVLEWDEQAAVQASIRADHERMGTLLRGLLAQAIKVSPRNERIVLSLVDAGAAVELRVADQGLALSSERAAKVFAQFHGVDSQAGPEFVGTGLRFAILRGVAEAHGGSIAIEPAASGGRGKTFVLSLPKIAGGGAGATQSAAPGFARPFVSPKPDVIPPVLPKAPLPPAVPAGPGPLGAMPPMPLPPLPGVQAPAVPAAAPVVYKPAPLDDTFNAPWKRKDSKLTDDLDELMNVSGAPVPPKAVPPSPLPVVGSAGAAATPSPAPLSKPAPAGADFDALFGPPPSPSLPPLPKPAPPVPGSLNTLDDLNNLLGQ